MIKKCAFLYVSLLFWGGMSSSITVAQEQSPDSVAREPVISREANALDTVEKPFRKHNIGFAGGFITGFLISYRHWFKNDHGFQITVGPYLDIGQEYSGGVDRTSGFLSLGTNGLYSMYFSRFSNLFLYYGLHQYYSFSSYPGQPFPDSGKKVVQKDFFYFLGGGPGIELYLGNVSLNLMAGIDVNMEIHNRDPETQWNKNYSRFKISPSGEIAIYYSFEGKKKN